MDTATGTLLGVLLGGLISLITTSVQARYGRKTAQITAENQARMQSEKLRHDASLAEITFKRAKLEELNQAAARATAYYRLSVAIFRADAADPPTLEQQLERYNEDMADIHRARILAELYFNSLTENITKLIGIVEDSLHAHRNYFKAKQPADLTYWTDEVLKLERLINETQFELNDKIAREASRLSEVQREPETEHPSGN